MEIAFDREFTDKIGGFHMYLVEAEVENSPTQDELWEELAATAERLRADLPLPAINKREAIAATRAAYKACGKDPNRYRPSAEALSRRLVKGMELYRTYSIVDLINLISIASGHSIGGFDAEKIVGEKLTLGVGHEGEEFEAIGRGPLNIAGLPVYRDAVGGIGTPTSDHERTKLTPSTRRLLMTINCYGSSSMDESAFLSELERLLLTYASAKEISIRQYVP